MTDLLDKLHADAGVAFLQANTNLTVHAEKVPDGARTPYVKVYSYTEWPQTGDANALDGRSVTCTVRWYCHCVGATEAAARAVAGQVRESLLNKRPAVAGRSVGLIYQEASTVPRPDESTGTAVYDQVAVYAATSAPG